MNNHTNVNNDNKDNKIENLTSKLNKINILKKFSLLSKLSFKNARTNLVSSIKNLKRENRILEKTWEIVTLSRNENRPKTIEYINGIFEDFVELSGDRLCEDDKAIVGGFAKLGERSVAVIGHNKGKNIKERVEFNFGMPNPSGYRKAMRIMEIAQRFNFPLITFIDTPGANPAIEAEDHGQASAISHSIEFMLNLKIPVICIFIGEGGSGGALALAIGNHLVMLENSTYSVISPEGCAAILWKDQKEVKKAAAMLKLTAVDLYKLGAVDKILREPKGGAQNSHEKMIHILKNYLKNILAEYDKYSGEELKELRMKKFESFGFFS